MRENGRKADEIRPVKITRNFIKFSEGSALIQIGDTKVICTASIEEKVPPFLKGTGSGWITAEYAMIPRSTQTRTIRDGTKGHAGGRTYEIQRLIGRALRAIANLKGLGERTIWIDCDVIQADGGTRTASITGAMIALADAVNYLRKQNLIREKIIKDYVAAISTGIVQENLLLDLTYKEDSMAQVDMNIVMTSSGGIVEIQGTAEGEPFEQKQLLKLLALGKKGIKKLIKIQKKILFQT